MYNEYFKIFFNIDEQENKQLKILFKESGLIIQKMIHKYIEIVNELTSKQSTITEKSDFIIILLLRKTIESLDSIIILWEKSCISQVEILMRSLYENCLSIKYILKKEENTDINIEKKACAYYLSEIYEKLNLDNNLSTIKIDSGKEFTFDEYKKIILDNKLIQNPVLNETNNTRTEKLNQINQSRRNRNQRNIDYIQWYAIYSDIRNIRQLADYVGWGDTHKELYRNMSLQSHVSCATNEVFYKEDGSMYPKLIRDPSESSTIFRLICTFSMSLLRDIWKCIEFENKLEIIDCKNFIEDFISNRDKFIKELNNIKIY